MPFSKNPNRYDPLYEFILMEMEKGTIEFELNLDNPKRATNVRLTLYGYANAWADAGQKAALRKDDAVAENCFAKAKTLARYKMVQMDHILRFINKDTGTFVIPKIHVIQEADEQPPSLGEEAAREILRAAPAAAVSAKEKESSSVRDAFNALMNPNPQPKGTHLRVVEATEDELNGPTSEP